MEKYSHQWKLQVWYKLKLHFLCEPTQKKPAQQWGNEKTGSHRRTPKSRVYIYICGLAECTLQK